MFAGLTGWHLVLILAIVLLLFGAPKLPGLARSVAQSMRIFRTEVKEPKDENVDEVTFEEPEDLETPVKTAKPKTSAAKPVPAKSSTAKPKK